MANIGKQYAVKGLNRHGEGLIQIYINFTRTHRKVISTGVYVEPKFWDAKKLIITKHPLALHYNYLIDNMKLSIQKLEIDCNETHTVFTPEIIDNFLSKGKPIKIFNKFYKNELDKSVSSLGTYKDQLKTLKHLNMFKPLIKFTELNIELVTEFDTYLHNLGHSQVTINCHHKNIKKYINLAISYGYFSNDENKYPYRSIKLPTTKSNRPYLTFEQVMKIYKTEYPTDRLRRVADRFVFACCTGFKVSDLSRITPGKFDGEVLIMEPEMISKTSGYTVMLPIKVMFNGLPYQILQKYGFTLPLFTDENYNKLLKTVANHAKIPPLVSHAARHTFLTIVALLSHDVYKVMKYGGIVSSETASIYIKMSKDYNGRLKIDEIWPGLRQKK